jgi:protein TonB
VLALDPTNSIALSGLRTISDVYVQQANTALRRGEPAQAIPALEIAAETDPENPAIAIANALLIAQGDGRLANARLAVADELPELAADFLSQAERYAHVDPTAINDVRLQIAQIEQARRARQERQFIARLAVADRLISTGRLIAPPDDNAHALLIELRKDHATDSRLLASTERLAEQQLTAAALAIAAQRFPVANELLDATDALGVLASDAAAIRMSMQRAIEKEETMVARIAAAESAPAESASAPAESAAQSVLSSDEFEEASPPENVAGEPASLPAPSGDESVPAAAAMADASTMVTDEPSKTRSVKFSDLIFEEYVAPKFPRSASRRGLTGIVELQFSVHADGSTGAIEIVNAEPSEIFVSSAQDAVKQWRFVPHEDEVKARVTLRFEQ